MGRISAKETVFFLFAPDCTFLFVMHLRSVTDSVKVMGSSGRSYQEIQQDWPVPGPSLGQAIEQACPEPEMREV